MRRLLENALLLVAVFVFLAVVRKGWEDRSALSAWLGGSDSRFVDATMGWVPIGGLLVFISLLPLRRPGSSSTFKKTLYVVPLLPWGVMGATFLWTPLAGDRAGWLDDLSSGGDAFQMGVVTGHWALAASAVLCLAIGVAQIVSPRWQPGNAANERRSLIASSAALAGPSLVGLFLLWIG